MRIAIVDYPGHAFPLQLARSLARRGHKVLHLYFRECHSPHGELKTLATDPVTLAIQPVSLDRAFPTCSFVLRRLHEIAIGRAFAARIDAFAPDIVIAGNCPLDCVRAIGENARRHGRKFIFWQQSIYSIAIDRILGRKHGLIGRLVGRYYRHIERRILATSDVTIVIGQTFVDAIRVEFDQPTTNIHVVKNWAPLADIPLRAKDNAWSRRHGLHDKTVVLYSGTCGLTNDPQQIFDLAVNLKDRPDARLVVVSQGPFADWLSEVSAEAGLTQIVVLPSQPYDALPDVLGSTDVIVAALDDDAGPFSVPPKVLSYLCAGRPIVLSAPPGNLAGQIIESAGAGVALAIGDEAGLVSAVRSLVVDKAARLTAGRQARIYAETTFDIAAITSRFEAIFEQTLALRGGSSTAPHRLPSIMLKMRKLVAREGLEPPTPGL